MYVDSHCHLDCLKFDEGLKRDSVSSERDQAEPYATQLHQSIQAAQARGVTQFLCVCIDLEHSQDVIDIAERYDNVLATVGVHPLYKDSKEPTVEALVNRVNEANATQRRVIAVGETGLDFHYCPEKPQWQIKRFEVHLEAALKLSMPLIIHSRSAKQETLERFHAYGVDRVGGVMHCFTEDLDMAKRCIDLGFLISFSGIVTFNNAQALRDVVAALPLDRMLIETDSPYLAPKPYRGQSNEPKYVVEVAQQIAEVKGVSVEEVASVTTGNYEALVAGRVNKLGSAVY